MIVASHAHRDGIRKAAILVASLDSMTADRLLDQLDADTAEIVRSMAAGIEQFDIDERRRVIDEFRRIGLLLPEKCPPGIELDGPFTAQLGQISSSYGAEHAQTTNLAGDSRPERPEQEENTTRQPFGFLQNIEDGDAVLLLEGERPQTVALVLSHLPAQRAGEILMQFEPELRVEAIRRLADLETADPATVAEIEQALESRLSRRREAERCRIAGPDAAAKILACCDGGMAHDILENLAAGDQKLAERLGRKTISFDDLMQLDDRLFSAVVKAVKPAIVQLGLIGAKPELVERVLKGMPQQDAKILQRKLDFPGPVRLSDVDAARRIIAAKAERIVYVATRKAA